MKPQLGKLTSKPLHNICKPSVHVVVFWLLQSRRRRLTQTTGCLMQTAREDQSAQQQLFHWDFSRSAVNLQQQRQQQRQNLKSDYFLGPNPSLIDSSHPSGPFLTAALLWNYVFLFFVFSKIRTRIWFYCRVDLQHTKTLLRYFVNKRSKWGGSIWRRQLKVFYI